MRAATWFALGPYGGSARAIAMDPSNPKHLYLGTTTGWLYGSRDGGASWQRIAHLANRNDLVLDNILVDARNPKRLIVGVYVIDRPEGGIFISEDGGKVWYAQAEMRGQSVRSLSRSPSNPDELVAGTLKGVYRSMDDGKHWELISPEGSTEIHEVESIAIDPADPNVIYAGTWHLPWKTTDGGAHWVNIKEGIIDDSDVFSIIIDPENPKIVYASACSGIYKSTSGAEPNPRNQDKRFEKVQGIPSAARRTRKLAQDPGHRDTVFAGTTEGLYRTLDGGIHWDRMTGPDVIVNDVHIDPQDSNHVLIATDRGGMYSSHDGGVTFEPSNNGFSQRQVVSYTADAAHPGTVYVGVVNDKQTGGVFQSVDGGVSWQQDSEGLGGRDVFSLASLSDGTLLAGTGHGIFRMQDGAWVDASAMAPATGAAPAAETKPAASAKPAVAKKPLRPAPRGRTVRRRPAPVAKPKPLAPPPVSKLDAVVYEMMQGEDGGVYAGTSSGLMRGDAQGGNWQAVAALEMPETRFLAVHKKMVMVAGLKRIALSMDDGATWDAVALPRDLTQIAAAAIDEQNNLWIGGREGVYYSTDYGMTWKTLRNLFITQVDGIYYDAANHRVLVTASNSTFAFAAHLPDYKVTYWDAGWNLRFVRPVGDHLLGATLYDGMVVEPRMVDSKFSDEKAAPGGGK